MCLIPSISHKNYQLAEFTLFIFWQIFTFTASWQLDFLRELFPCEEYFNTIHSVNHDLNHISMINSRELVGVSDSCMCYTLDLVQKIPKLKLKSFGYFP